MNLIAHRGRLWLWTWLWIALSLYFCGCSTDDDHGSETQDTADTLEQGETTDDALNNDLGESEEEHHFPNLPGGNPLVPEVAAYPYPSDFYLVKDPTTRTGRRIEIPQEALPALITPDILNSFDGFTRIPQIVAYLPQSVDVSTLPSPTDPSESIAPDSTVYLVREGTWEKIPVLAEVDANAQVPTLQALLIRPLIELDPNTGYVVILREGLRDVNGNLHQANEAFKALRDHIPTDDPSIEKQREDFELTRQAIDALGLDPQKVVLAWSFHTRSEEDAIATLVEMQMSVLDFELSDYQITKDKIEGENRQIEGVFTAPNYLSEDNLIVLDEEGHPKRFGSREVPFVLTIPINIDEPRPVLLYGHGFLGTRYQTTGGSFNSLCRQFRLSAVGTEFGFYEDVTGDMIGALSSDMHYINVAVSKVMQAFVNNTTLIRVVKEQLAQDIVDDQGNHLIDPEAVHFLGISNGGTCGYVMAATCPLLSKAVLVVGGGGLVHFLERAVEWHTFEPIVRMTYHSNLDEQLVFAMIQNNLDPVDSMNYAIHIVEDRLAGMKPLKASVHMAVNDSEVRNLVTEWVMRSAHIPMVVPSPKEIWGLDTIEAPLPDGAPEDTLAVLYVYDEHVEPSPITNVPPEENNRTHNTVRDLDVYKEHIGHFIETGRFVQVCDGACDPE